MKIIIGKRKGWKALVWPLLLVVFVSVSYAETDQEIAARMAKEAKEAADRAEKREKEDKGQTNYDIKKTHDEHITITEKAAGEAEKNKNK